MDDRGRNAASGVLLAVKLELDPVGSVFVPREKREVVGGAAAAPRMVYSAVLCPVLVCAPRVAVRRVAKESAKTLRIQEISQEGSTSRVRLC